MTFDHNVTRTIIFACAAILAPTELLSTSNASEILVVDRLSNTVDRYSPSGSFLGTLISGDPNLNQPDGIAVSPDQTKLFVASSQNNEVIEYDYDYSAGTATNPTVFATATDGLAFPNSLVFSPDGSKLYVANLGGTGITQLNATGGLAGPPIAGGSSFSFSGLAFNSAGQLVAGGFDGNSVAISNSGVTSLSDLVAPNSSILGAAGVLVDGNALYVTGLFSGTLVKYNATTGAADPSFNVGGLAFPQGIVPAPGGNGLLVGVLGVSNGAGNISRYGFDGSYLGTFASSVTNSANGFVEATAFVVVPEPASLCLAGTALLAVGLAAFRRKVR